MTKVEFVVLGNLPRKSNSRRIFTNRKTNRPIIVKSADALDYERSFAMQTKGVPKGKFDKKQTIALTAWVYYRNPLSDLSDELLCDLMEKTGIIPNDRQIKVKHLYGGIDKVNPRVIVVLEVA
jgi:hypothetical protein